MVRTTNVDVNWISLLGRKVDYLKIVGRGALNFDKQLKFVRIFEITTSPDFNFVLTEKGVTEIII